MFEKLLSGVFPAKFALILAVLAVLSVAASSAALAHGEASMESSDPGRLISFVDVPGYKTLTTDLHTHSVFSDGHVWPRIRVEEALRDGLDGLAITEHLEWQPHLSDIPHPDRNRAFDIALEAAAGKPLLVILGAEITRNWPTGHVNAVFLQDANPLLQLGTVVDPADIGAVYQQASQWPPMQAIEAAAGQGAFLFWNHPFWSYQRPDGIAVLPEFHQQAIKAGVLHGIEIANGDEYSEEAFAIALANNLAVIGVSDVHELIDWDYAPHLGRHRPLTLVFAEDKSAAAVKAALFARRTVVYFKDMLFGREADLLPLLQASLQITSKGYVPKTQIAELQFSNLSDAPLMLQNTSAYTLMNQGDVITVAGHTTVTVMVKTKTEQSGIDLQFVVLNALTAPKVPASIAYKVSL
ncbi:MAG: Sb-PDE family phosphodiesterase [Pseudomonadales bacterium]|nr:Sb-PDE family phosphodiesterase [Pseudomonadales bacterium]